MVTRERGDRVGEVEASDPLGRNDRERALGLVVLATDRRVLLLDLIEQALRELEVALALLGEADGASGAVDQPYAELALELGDVARDQRAGDARASARPR